MKLSLRHIKFLLPRSVTTTQKNIDYNYEHMTLRSFTEGGLTQSSVLCLGLPSSWVVSLEILNGLLEFGKFYDGSDHVLYLIVY